MQKKCLQAERTVQRNGGMQWHDLHGDHPLGRIDAVHPDAPMRLETKMHDASRNGINLLSNLLVCLPYIRARLPIGDGAMPKARIARVLRHAA